MWFLALLFCSIVSSEAFYARHLPATNNVLLTIFSTSRAVNNDDDKGFRTLRRVLPKPVQYWLRDSGVMRFIIDRPLSLAVLLPSVLSKYPQALPLYLTLPTKRLRYGSHSRQEIHLVEPPTTSTVAANQSLVVFVHGGAWGSGFPELYRLCSLPFLERGQTVAVVGYRTYPCATVPEQVEDLRQSVEYLKTNYQFSDWTLMGHSSGTHISLLALQDVAFATTIDRFVGLAGVYDILNHYKYEKTRGVERLSPLAPANGGSVAAWRKNSPIHQSYRALPPTLVCHGALDSTVPFTGAVEFGMVVNVTTRIMSDTGHQDMVTDLMFGGPTRDVVMQWLQR